eukprot:s6264_g4.t1
MMDEDEAIMYSRELLTYVYGEAADRWHRKAKEKARPRAKEKPKARERATPTKVSGSTAPGWNGATWTTDELFNKFVPTVVLEREQVAFKSHTPQLVTSKLALDVISASSWATGAANAHNAGELQILKDLDRPSSKRARTGADGSETLGTGIFFAEAVEPMAPMTGCVEDSVCHAGGVASHDGSMSWPCTEIIPPHLGECFNEPYELTAPKVDENMEQYMSESFLSYTFASAGDEPASGALVDTAAQHGLIGEQTLMRHEAPLQIKASIVLRCR